FVYAFQNQGPHDKAPLKFSRLQGAFLKQGSMVIGGHHDNITILLTLPAGSNPENQRAFNYVVTQATDKFSGTDGQHGTVTFDLLCPPGNELKSGLKSTYSANFT